VQLFVQRARSGQPDFALSDWNAAAVARICAPLDGLPLAIELAAARVSSLPLEELATQLAQNLAMLAGGPRDALPRQQTLQATLDWSWALLGEPERVLLRRLSVFASGWMGETAALVCGGAELVDWPLSGLLGGLVNKSLVELHEGTDRGRYGVLGTVRQYAADQLAAAGEENTLRGRHLDWCLALAVADRRLVTLRAGALDAAGSLAYQQCDYGRAAALHEEALALRREVGDTSGIAASLSGLGHVAFQQGDYARAAILHEQALALRRKVEDRWGMTASLHCLARVASRQADDERAVALLTESLVLGRDIGAGELTAESLEMLAWLAAIRARPLRARMAADQHRRTTIWPYTRCAQRWAR
jgi:predicted ATPase